MAAPLKIACVVGTRPEVVKMAPVLAALQDRKQVHCLLWNTGQHQQLANEALSTFGLLPDADLTAMARGQSLAAMGANILLGLEQLIRQERPQVLLAQGDTCSVMMTGLAGFYAGVRTGHVEAGLRTAI